MRKKFDIITFLIVFFLVIGVVNVFLTDLSSIIIPLIIFGFLFYFLKNPGKLSRITKKKYYRNQNNSHNGKKAKFTIIQGQKKDDDDLPKYH